MVCIITTGYDNQLIFYSGGHMSLPDRNNPYNFDNFLNWRQNVDYYRDDPFIQKVVRHFTGNEWETLMPGPGGFR
jgi:hypothetical protein